MGTVKHPSEVPKDQRELLKEKLPNFETDSVSGSGQYIHEEQPGAVVDAVQRLEAARPPLSPATTPARWPSAGAPRRRCSLVQWIHAESVGVVLGDHQPPAFSVGHDIGRRTRLRRQFDGPASGCSRRKPEIAADVIRDIERVVALPPRSRRAIPIRSPNRASCRARRSPRAPRFGTRPRTRVSRPHGGFRSRSRWPARCRCPRVRSPAFRARGQTPRPGPRPSSRRYR